MAGSRVKGITIELNGDTTGLDKALSSVNKQATATNSELKDINKLLKLDPGNTNLLAQKFDLMKTSVSQAQEKLQTLQNSEKQVNDAFKNGDLGEAQYRSFQRELENAKIDLEHVETGAKNTEAALKGSSDGAAQAEAGFKQTSSAMSGLSNEADGTKNSVEGLAGSMNTLSMQGVANGLQQAGQYMKEFGQQTLDSFREVDDGMDTVAAKSNLTSDQTQKLFESLNTEVPGTNFQAMGDAVGGLNQQFNLTGDALDKSSAYLLKFASTNKTDVTGSITGAKDAMALFHLDASKLPSVLDSVSGTAKNTGLSVDTIWQTLQNGAPALQNMGLNLDQSVQMLGMFESSGVDANGAIAALTKGATNFAKNGKTLSQGLQDVGQKMKETTDPAAQMSLAVDTFGAKAGPRMLDMLKSGKLSLDQFGQASTNVGVVGKTFEAQVDPIDKMTTTQNESKMAMANLGAQIQESLGPVMDTLTDIIKGLSSWFSTLPGPVKSFVVVLALVVTGILLLMPVIMAIIGPIIAFGGASGAAAGGVGALMLSMLPIVGIILGIIVVIGLIIAAVTNWGKIVDWLNGVWQSAVKLFNSVTSQIGKFFSNLGEDIQNIWNDVVSFVSSIPGKIISFFSSIGSSIGNFFSPIINYVTNAFDAVINYVSSIPGRILGFFSNIGSSIGNFFSGIHIPMPHFGVKPAGWNIGDLLKGQIPSLSVDWYAKGGIFTKPTLFATDQGLKGMGESGAEAALPLNPQTLGAIGQGIASTMASNAPQANVTINIYANGPISEREIMRQSKNTLRELGYQVN